MYKSPSGKRYIGKTTHKDIRHRNHGYAYGDSPYFHKAIRKHKWENFSYEILEEFDDDVTDEFMSDRETHWIEEYDSTNRAFGYNLTKGGEGMTGYKHTDVSKAKISEAHKGHIVSAETRTKISEANKGRKHTDATKAKMSEARKGHKHTDATKAKMSEARKGHIVSAETRTKISEANKGRIVSAEARANMSEAQKGKKLSAEHRAKISDALKGKNNPNFGKKLSAEHRAKMSEARKGHKHTDATKAKISDANKGRIFSDATKAKISEAKKGHIVSAATRAKLSKPVIATEKKTGKKREFESACAAARTLSDETGKKFCNGAVSGCANKRRKSHHGWTFSHL